MIDAKLRTRRLDAFMIVIMALVFTAGLMFASAEMPRAVDGLLDRNIDFLDVATGQDSLAAYKTELFLSRYHIRLIGYVCLGLIVVLIIAGFVLEKRRLASAGAVILFLPVFGHFAATMFFLGGLAFLRFIWLPFLDISFDVMRLGDVILLPYQWILKGFSAIGLNLYRELPFIITGLGIFIFLLGVLAWMFGKIRRTNVTDFWIYRFSRHPQYLGWIVWSYGLLFLPGANMKRYVDVDNSLPWLLATMIIIGVALLEERKMKRQYGNAYESYRGSAPFLFPLPRFVRRGFSLPLSLIFRKAYPERKREIVWIIAFYTMLCVIISAFSAGMIRGAGDGRPAEENIGRLVRTIRTSQNRGVMRNAAATLASLEGAGVDSLVALLEHENPFVRWYCASALGGVRSEKTVQPLASLLNDPEDIIRKVAAGSLGGTGSARAIPILIEAYMDSAKGVEREAARALGGLRAREAVPMLVEGLKAQDTGIVRSCAAALGHIGATEAIEPLVECFERRADCDFCVIGDALRALDSDRAVDAYIAGLASATWWVQSSCVKSLGELKPERGFDPLVHAMRTGETRVRRAAVFALSQYPPGRAEAPLEEALNDEDWEVRMYAEEALKRIREKSE